jgi:hypothetical protein
VIEENEFLSATEQSVKERTTSMYSTVYFIVIIGGGNSNEIGAGCVSYRKFGGVWRNRCDMEINEAPAERSAVFQVGTWEG